MRCKNCKLTFEGRANQLYCSVRCKSSVNNKRVADRDSEFVKAEKIIRKNRAIAMQLHALFGNEAFSKNVLDNSKINPDYFTSFGKNNTFIFHDYGIRSLKDNTFIITKIE